MKPLRIRQWMMVGMLMILILPRLFYELPGLFDWYTIENGEDAQQQMAINDLVREVGEADVKLWSDPTWQEEIEKTMDAAHSGILLLHADGQEIYSFKPSGLESVAGRELSIMEKGQLQGKALFYSPKQTSVLAMVLAILVGILAILFIRFQIGRVVVKPLEAISATARRIASGDLDVQLPKSTVKEVADIRTAFEAMGKGLQESLIRQSELEEERRFFLRSIAHDLRTPLFALRGFLTRLERGNNPEKTARYVAICSKKAKQLEHLVSDLFSYDQMSSLEQMLHPEPLDICSLFKDITADYLSQAKEKGIELTCEVPVESHVLQADAHLLRRAIGNLIDNALHFTPADGYITIRMHVRKMQAYFTIEDNGPGIQEQQLPHIFDAFYRGDDSRNLENGGTGLGLTIALRIIRAHNGDLKAENRSEGGTVITGWIK